MNLDLPKVLSDRAVEANFRLVVENQRRVKRMLNQLLQAVLALDGGGSLPDSLRSEIIRSLQSTE